MITEIKSPTTPTPEIQEAVTSALQGKGDSYWSGPRNYETMTPDRVYGQLEDVYKAVTQHNPEVDADRLERAYSHSRRFARFAFRNYRMTDGELFGGPFDSVFAVPLRADGKNPAYASDTNAFFPILSREFGITPEMQLRGVLGVPPSVIETNTQGSGTGERGATIFVPLFTTMLEDYNNNPAELARVGGSIMQKAAELTHVRLGAKVLGLGGTFPKISGYGAMFKYHPKHDMRELVTTTGHGGTVFLINETIKVLQETETFRSRDVKLGVVGAAGSIGWSTIESVLELVGDFDVHTNDHRAGDLAEKICGYEEKHGKHLSQSETAMDVLRQSDIIVSAVTRPINLDDIDPLDLNVPVQERSLAGKVIIDDSEPKAFRRDQVEARGGFMVNVAGEDDGTFPALRGDGLWTGGPETPYNFGDEAGLYGGAAWGCDAERVVLSWAGADKEAVAADVTPGNVRNIGRLCLEAGVRVAPFQIDSSPVFIP